MDGILLIHKEANMTSHDVVSKLRRILHTKKIGHSGTLDPNATGVLLVMIGNATKALPYLEDTDKEYVATLKLGERTLTDDIWGECLETKEVSKITDFQAVLDTFKGLQKQVPPMVSSVRVNGKKLYEYARAGQVVERPIREVTIYAIEALDEINLSFRVHCSSGTYVRTLCVDIADKTNNLGCMSSLVRTAVGRFHLDECVTLADVEQGNYQLHSLNRILAHYPMIAYEPIQDVYHGKKIQLDAKEDEVVIVHEEKVVAVYTRDHGKFFRSSRGLW